MISEQKADNMSILPPLPIEVVEIIFQKLSGKSLHSARLVSKSWDMFVRAMWKSPKCREIFSLSLREDF